MRQKPARKNCHKEKIFTLNQNKINFNYQKDHQEQWESRIYDRCIQQNADYNQEHVKKGLHVA